jgi:peptidoglycan/LPS O-acetylase OafA/YrhL
MNRTIIIFVIAAMVLITLILWIMEKQLSINTQEMLMIAVPLIVVGFAIFVGIARAKSLLRKEPIEDELSKTVMTKASSISYHVSIYLWLFIMYMSDKTTMPTHSLIGAGILGMAILFVLSWVAVKTIGLKHG